MAQECNPFIKDKTVDTISSVKKVLDDLKDIFIFDEVGIQEVSMSPELSESIVGVIDLLIDAMSYEIQRSTIVEVL